MRDRQSGDLARDHRSTLDDEPVDADALPLQRADDAPGTPSGRRRGVRRALIGAGVLVLALVAGGGLWFLTNRYGGNINRVGNVFAGLDDVSRPAAASPAGQPAASEDPSTFLLVGSDTRADIATGELPDARSDAIMIARFTADQQHAQLISIPRDSWVDIPGHGKNKINTAYAFGGPTLLIQTVEQLTGVRIDHYAAIDFDGLIQVTDDLGGVDVTVPETTSWGPYTFTAGINHLDGDQARWYVGQRYGLPGGDFDRVKRQQNCLRAMFTKLFSQQVFTSPGRLDSSLLAVTDAVAPDDDLSNADLVTMAYGLRGLTPAIVEFFTAPVLGTGTEGSASVVYLDANTGNRRWGYLQTDSLGPNADEFADQALPEVTN
ncbi:transcriptional attenuator, LytR family [Modestobacter sp. DSM 44400]|uniref:LCP family protein n=1 Tax=Modestobacter sp. DSM 44400 TaxID=1550230 RepID=UPI0008969D20|nr:LCP family protein [Modestobacter sp. DSM 44400]SDY66755.1 transcriptional attenuator, LytR family [Modestobacter sp. DSM 44400]